MIGLSGTRREHLGTGDIKYNVDKVHNDNKMRLFKSQIAYVEMHI